MCEITSHRFGPFISTVTGYLYIKNFDKEIKKSLILFFFNKNISNKQIKIKTERFLRVYSYNIFFKLLSQAIIFWGREKNHILKLKLTPKIFPKWSEHGKVQLYFSSEEKKRGLILLEKLGIKANDHWICIHNRESAYLNKALPNRGPQQYGNWAHHNYRDFSVKSMLPAAEFFINKGYHVIRMGAAVNEKIFTESKDSKVIDYVNSELRDDFSDMYLLTNCKAYLGSDSGTSQVPYIFKKGNFINKIITVI